MKALTPAKKYLWKIIVAPFLKVVECGTQLATPFLVRYIIDDGIGNGNMKTVWSLGALVFGLAVVAFGVTMVAQYLSARAISIRSRKHGLWVRSQKRALRSHE